MSGRRQTVFRLEKNRAGMRRKCAHDDGLEFLKLFAWHGMLFYFQLGREQFSQRVALVDGKRGNDSAGVRDGFKSLALAWRQLHCDPPLESYIGSKAFSCEKRGEPTAAPFWQF